MTDNLRLAQDALGGIRESLQADGYDIEVAGLKGSTLSVTIRALEGACADCLVPASVMEGIIMSVVSPATAVDRVELTYP